MVYDLTEQISRILSLHHCRHVNMLRMLGTINNYIFEKLPNIVIVNHENNYIYNGSI